MMTFGMLTSFPKLYAISTCHPFKQSVCSTTKKSTTIFFAYPSQKISIDCFVGKIIIKLKKGSLNE